MGVFDEEEGNTEAVEFDDETELEETEGAWILWCSGTDDRFDLLRRAVARDSSFSSSLRRTCRSSCNSFFLLSRSSLSKLCNISEEGDSPRVIEKDGDVPLLPGSSNLPPI